MRGLQCASYFPHTSPDMSSEVGSSRTPRNLPEGPPGVACVAEGLESSAAARLVKLDVDGGAGYAVDVPLAEEELLARSSALLPHDRSAEPTRAAPLTSWAPVNPPWLPAGAACPGCCCCCCCCCEPPDALGAEAASAKALPAQLTPATSAAWTMGFFTAATGPRYLAA